MNERTSDDVKKRLQLKGTHESVGNGSLKNGVFLAETTQKTDERVISSMRKTDREKRSRIGNMILEPAAKGLQKSAHELKETIKRPLTGLLRRPLSRGGDRNMSKDEVGLKSGVEISTTSHTNVSTVSQALDKGAGSDALESQKLASLTSLQKLYSMEPKPSVPVRLDAVNPKDAWMSKLDDTDLFLLTRFLCSEDEAKEEAVPWSWDYLFACISAELREEWASEEEQFEEKY